MVNYKQIYCASNEYNPSIVDRFERVPPFLANPYAPTPVVSQLLYNEGFRPVYKDNKKYAVCFSHDIDFLYEPKNKNAFLISTAESLKRGTLNRLGYNLKNLIGKVQNPEWVLDILIDLENKHNIKSTYYFLCLANGDEDYNYDIESQRGYIKQLTAAGYEIGLHGGHKAYNSIDKILEEKKRLESVTETHTQGYRNHYLRFKTPDTWYYLKELGFAYDTTFGFPDQIGYRNGMCYPFRPYDHVKGSYIDILELPLLVMDVTFFKYMGLNVENAFKVFKKIQAEVQQLNGVLTIVWHNNCLTGEYRQLYDMVVAEVLKTDDAWITTSLEMTNWWKEHNMNAMETIVNDKILTK
jgi:hypothetical protein